MSTVAKQIQRDLLEKNKTKSEIINLSDFYNPIRGNLRRGRSRAGSSIVPQDQEQSSEIIKEIKTIEYYTDFDDPKQIDFELLIKGLRLLK